MKCYIFICIYIIKFYHILEFMSTSVLINLIGLIITTFNAKYICMIMVMAPG